MFALICLKSKFCILNVTCAVSLSNYYENFHIFKPGSHFPLFSVCHLKFTFLYVSRVSVKNYLKIHNIQIVHKTSGVGRSYEKCTHWEVLGFPSKVQAPIRGTGIVKSLIYIHCKNKCLESKHNPKRHLCSHLSTCSTLNMFQQCLDSKHLIVSTLECVLTLNMFPILNTFSINMFRS